MTASAELDEAASRLERAMTLMSARRWQDARSELAHALAADPESAMAHCMLASCHLQLGEHRAGAKATRAALRIDPACEWAYRLRSVALHELGDHPRAIRAAKRAVQLAPERADAHACLAQTLLGIEGLEQAAHDAALRAVELDPGRADVRVVLGLAKEGRRDRAGARQVYASALSLDPHHPDALRLLGGLEMARGRLNGAVRLLAAALRSDPGSSETQADLDRVVGRLSRRLLLLLMVGGIVVAQLAREEAIGGSVLWWHRGLAGTGLLALVVRLGWGPLRQLPPSMRPHFRGLPGRLRNGELVSSGLLLVVTLLVVATTVLPASAARWVGGFLAFVAVLMISTAQLLGMFGLAGTVGRAGRRAVSRGSR